LGEAKWGEESRANLPELDDALSLGLKDADEDGKHHYVAPEYAPDYLRKRKKPPAHTLIPSQLAREPPWPARAELVRQGKLERRGLRP